MNRLHTSLQPLGIDYEFVFVNDASTDRSREMLQGMRETDPAIKIVNMSRKFGGPQCVMAGMEYSSGDAVVYMDSDLQDPPEVLPEMVREWRDGADVVYTTRLSRAGENRFKMWLTKKAYRVINLFSEIELPVDSGDFKLLDRRVVEHLLELKEKDIYVKGLVTWLGFDQRQVFYHREPRHAGKTHYPLYGIGPVKAFLSGLTSFSIVPLSMALVLGFVVSFGAFAYLVAVVVMKFMDMNLPGWSAIMVTMLFLGGTQLFTIGIVGLYLGKIFNESKNRPRFVVESSAGFETEEEADEVDERRLCQS